ncbi:SDR family oxidoreductase [Candidatus Omnitrophota bacterium]
MGNYLVTGGAGFIGSHLVDRLLSEGNFVTIIDNFSTGRLENISHQKNNKKLLIIKEDIALLENIFQYFQDIDIVFHLASLADIVPSIKDPVNYYKSNVAGTFSVVEASRLSKVKKLIYTASSSCYGIPDRYPTSEKDEIRPQYPYALTKYIGEQIALHWAQVYKLPTISLRLFNVYGPRSRTSGTYGAVFGVFLAQKLAKKPFTIVGDGNQKRDFIFVADVVEAFVKSAHSKVKNEIFNVGTGCPQSINRLVGLLHGDSVYIPKRPGEPDCTWADTNKIKRKMNWKPEISFEEGVSKILEQIDYWKNAPVWTPEKIEKVTLEWNKCLS